MSDLDSWPVDEHVRVASPSVPCVTPLLPKAPFKWKPRLPLYPDKEGEDGAEEGEGEEGG